MLPGGVPLQPDVQPIRPNDRNAEGFKQQIRTWYDWVERRISASAVFVVREQLGEGGQGRAMLVERSDVPGNYAVAKIFAKESDARDEIHMLKTASGQHSNLVRMIEEWFPDRPIPGVSVLFLEYCEQGSLSDYRETFVEGKKPIPEAVLWHVATSLGRALAFLHTGWPTPAFHTVHRRNYAIVHRDIKPENILLKSDPSQPYGVMVKLGDFGMAARQVRDNGGNWQPIYSNGGTHDWQAPEHVAAPHYAGMEQDMWSLGAIIHYLAVGEPPIDILRANSTFEYKSQPWKASIPRRITKISSRPDLRKGLGHQKHYPGDGHLEWSLKYSIKINRWMMRMLKITPSERVKALEVAQTMHLEYKF